MLLVTEEGRINISESQILCVDRRNGIAGQPFVTLYLLSGEHISGIVESREPSIEDGSRFASSRPGTTGP